MYLHSTSAPIDSGLSVIRNKKNNSTMFISEEECGKYGQIQNVHEQTFLILYLILNMGTSADKSSL